MFSSLVKPLIDEGTYVSTDTQISIFKAALARLEAARQPLCSCALCSVQYPADDLYGISDQDDADRVSGLLEIDPESDMCPDCRAEIVKEARAKTCRHCNRAECPGPIIQTDADRWECPRPYRW